jgi:hypothetical protein
MSFQYDNISLKTNSMKTLSEDGKYLRHGRNTTHRINPIQSMIKIHVKCPQVFGLSLGMFLKLLSFQQYFSESLKGSHILPIIFKVLRKSMESPESP